MQRISGAPGQVDSVLRVCHSRVPLSFLGLLRTGFWNAAVFARHEGCRAEQATRRRSASCATPRSSTGVLPWPRSSATACRATGTSRGSSRIPFRPREALIAVRPTVFWLAEGLWITNVEHRAGDEHLGSMISSARAIGTTRLLPLVALRTSGMRCPRTRSSRSSFSSASSSSTAKAPMSGAPGLVTIVERE